MFVNEDRERCFAGSITPNILAAESVGASFQRQKMVTYMRLRKSCPRKVRVPAVTYNIIQPYPFVPFCFVVALRRNKKRKSRRKRRKGRHKNDIKTRKITCVSRLASYVLITRERVSLLSVSPSGCSVFLSLQGIIALPTTGTFLFGLSCVTWGFSRVVSSPLSSSVRSPLSQELFSRREETRCCVLSRWISLRRVSRNKYAFLFLSTNIYNKGYIVYVNITIVINIENYPQSLGVRNISCQISRKLLKIPFLCKSMKLVFFNDEFNGVYHFK